MIGSPPRVSGAFLDEQELHLYLTVGDGADAAPFAILRADRGDKTVEVDFSADVFQDMSLDMWGLVKEFVEGHLEAILPHPEITASWGRPDDDVWQPFLPYVGDEYAAQIGGCG